MMTQLLTGGLLIALTVIFHALALDVIIKNTDRLHQWRRLHRRALGKAFTIAVIVLWITGALVIEIWLWGTCYLVVGVLPDLETALYFSTASFTTLGYGDIVLSQEWRLLGTMEAANGLILFGWSTAFIFEVVSRLYRKEAQEIKG